MMSWKQCLRQIILTTDVFLDAECLQKTITMHIVEYNIKKLVYKNKPRYNPEPFAERHYLM